MEVIQEYDNWRKVRDPKGDEGWILHSLLSGKRTVIVNPGAIGAPGQLVNMQSAPETQSKSIARLEPGVIGEIRGCQEKWCSLLVDGTQGFVAKSELWGVYPDELIE